MMWFECFAFGRCQIFAVKMVYVLSLDLSNDVYLFLNISSHKLHRIWEECYTLKHCRDLSHSSQRRRCPEVSLVDD